MPSLTNEQCYKDVDRFSERVVIITGAGSGFGRATAIDFVQNGAFLVLGDVDEVGLAETVNMCKATAGVLGGSSVVSRKCDVTKWEDQVALFELAVKTYGAVDIVLPNAGVSEIGRFEDVATLTPPNLTTLDIDLTGVLYTTRIALYHMVNDKRKDPGLRAIVFTGSMSTFYGSEGVMYGVAKAGILGIQKGIASVCNKIGVRVGTVCPYFSKTNILAKTFVHPNPKLGYAKIEDVVAAFVSAITDSDPKTNFGCYLIPDQKGVYRMESTGQFIGAEAAYRGFKKAEKKAKL